MLLYIIMGKNDNNQLMVVLISIPHHKLQNKKAKPEKNYILLQNKGKNYASVYL